jgi:hypothetical protein
VSIRNSICKRGISSLPLLLAQRVSGWGTKTLCRGLSRLKLRTRREINWLFPKSSPPEIWIVREIADLYPFTVEGTRRFANLLRLSCARPLVLPLKRNLLSQFKGGVVHLSPERLHLHGSGTGETKVVALKVRFVANRSILGFSQWRTIDWKTAWWSSHSVLTGAKDLERESTRTFRRAVLLALSHFKLCLESLSIVLATNNTTVVAYQKNQGGTHCYALYQLAKDVCFGQAGAITTILHFSPVILWRIGARHLNGGNV